MTKVLVVGKESEERLQAVTTLTNNSYDVAVADSGEEAWEKISSALDDYKLVVSFFTPDDISTIGLIARIREEPLLEGLGIILLASAEQPREQADNWSLFAYQTGADICLSFLYPEELLAFGRRLIERVIETRTPSPPRCFECNKPLSEIPAGQKNLTPLLGTLVSEVAVSVPNQGWFLFCCQDHAKWYELQRHIRFPVTRMIR
jgi:CheY-like chemotaxis protein